MDPQPALHDFLRQKGIDADAMAQAMPVRYARFVAILQASGTMGLDYAHKFLWNDLRLEFPAEDRVLKKD